MLLIHEKQEENSPKTEKEGVAIRRRTTTKSSVEPCWKNRNKSFL
jgi:hypothetical protein